MPKVTKCKQNAHFYLHTFEKPRTFFKYNLHFANKMTIFAYTLSFYIQNAQTHDRNHQTQPVLNLNEIKNSTNQKITTVNGILRKDRSSF